MFNRKQSVRMFLDSLREDVDKLQAIIERPLEMNLTAEQRLSVTNATICHICDGGKKDNDIFVADHCHVTGEFRGAAHQSCNLNYRLDANKYKVPIFFHNLKGYDAHFIIREVVPKRHGEITCIPKTGEQFISFSVGNMVFKDSYAFQSDSLDNLASSLSDDDKHHIKSLADAYAVDKNTAYDVFTKFATPSRKRKSKTKKSTSKRAKTDDEFIDDEPMEQEMVSFYNKLDKTHFELMVTFLGHFTKKLMSSIMAYYTFFWLNFSWAIQI